MKVDEEDFKSNYSDEKLGSKLSRFGKTIGLKSLYMVLLLYYAYRRKETPSWAKNIIIGTLGYLIAPIDFIPDLTPILGFTDDIGVLSFGLITIACYVDADVKKLARTKVGKWFHNFDEGILDNVEQEMNI